MDKKTYKRRCRRLWAATEIWLDGSDGYPCRAKAAKKPLTGKSLRRLLSGGMAAVVGNYADENISCGGWLNGILPRVNPGRRYVLRLEEFSCAEPGFGLASVRRVWEGGGI